MPGLADSKLLTEKARERAYAQIVRRAVSWAVVVVPHDECDRLGMHVANVEALRRAVAKLTVPPDYVLTDGFPVDGLGVPGLAVWKGDRVAACIAAGSVLAKVTRDRIMTELDADYPAYDFKTHKGYITDVHSAALERARAVPGAPDAVRERTAGRRPRDRPGRIRVGMNTPRKRARALRAEARFRGDLRERT